MNHNSDTEFVRSLSYADFIMIKSNRHARSQQQSDLQMVQTQTAKKNKKQDRYSIVGRESVRTVSCTHVHKTRIWGYIFV